MKVLRTAMGMLAKSIPGKLWENSMCRRLGVTHLIHRIVWLTEQDYSYESAWKKFNERYFYRPVGSYSLREFFKQGEIMFRGMLRNGLAPSSSILDVGCGTGRLTNWLYDYLSNDAYYVGLDIAPEPVDFCRRRFTKANFVFQKNEGINIPDLGRRFDFILFFSVFTHMYPQEMVGMLRHCREILADGGRLLASFWFCGDPGSYSTSRTFIGNRSRMEYNRDYLRHILTGEAWVFEEQDWGLGQKVLLMTPIRGKTSRELTGLE